MSNRAAHEDTLFLEKGLERTGVKFDEKPKVIGINMLGAEISRSTNLPAFGSFETTSGARLPLFGWMFGFQPLHAGSSTSSGYQKESDWRAIMPFIFSRCLEVAVTSLPPNTIMDSPPGCSKSFKS